MEARLLWPLTLFSMVFAFSASKGPPSLPDDAGPYITGQLQHLDVLIVYTTCPFNNRTKRAPFDWRRLPCSSVALHCNKSTLDVDCFEAVPMLDFFVQNYDRPLARKYIFIHAHERSWHYPESIYVQLAFLLNSSYFATQDFGGLYATQFSSGAWGNKECSQWAEGLYQFLFAGTSMPKDPPRTSVSRPCCASFFMSSDLVKMRAKAELLLFRNRLQMWSRQNKHLTKGPAWYCSRLMEDSWHLMFYGKQNVPRGPEVRAKTTAIS